MLFRSVSEGDYDGLLEYQRKIREEQLVKRHKKETDAWDQYLAQVPKLPADWDHWVDKEGIEQNYIFYDYSRKKNQKGYCSWCEKEVPIEKLRHNKEGVCPACGRKIQFKARGRAGRFWTDQWYVYLLQDCKDGMVARRFSAWRYYRKGEYETPECTCRERWNGSWKMSARTDCGTGGLRPRIRGDISDIFPAAEITGTIG